MHQSCKHCRDAVKKWECRRCKRFVTDQCRLCHNELVHDKIVPQFMRPQFGGAVDPGWRDDEDSGGYGANAPRRTRKDFLTELWSELDKHLREQFIACKPGKEDRNRGASGESTIS